MHPRAAALVAELGLRSHPEGGFFREVFRSPHAVAPEDGRGGRAALTVIHFLLPAGQASRWHAVRSDEQWTFLEGDPIELLVVEPATGALRRHLLGPSGDGRAATAVVPAGHWQAARPTGAYGLATCTVGPGFDFADFRMLADDARDSDRLRRLRPELAELL